ncbi:unnamed protein product, partial [Didymodactylos carnosus]
MVRVQEDPNTPEPLHKEDNDEQQQQRKFRKLSRLESEVPSEHDQDEQVDEDKVYMNLSSHTPLKILYFKKHSSDKQPQSHSTFVTILKLNSPEWLYILFGCLACAVNGTKPPIFSVLVGKTMQV